MREIASIGGRKRPMLTRQWFRLVDKSAGTVLLKLFQKSLRLPLQIHALRVVFLSFSLCPSVFLYGFKMHLRASQGPLEGA